MEISVTMGKSDVQFLESIINELSHYRENSSRPGINNT